MTVLAAHTQKAMFDATALEVIVKFPLRYLRIERPCCSNGTIPNIMPGITLCFLGSAILGSDR